LNFIEFLRQAQRSQQATRAIAFLVIGMACLAQDPFSSMGAAALTISTGTFVTGLIEFAIVVGGMLLAFSGRVLGGVLVAIIGGGLLALAAAKYAALAMHAGAGFVLEWRALWD
jgi:hypothetical protein